ncbi:MAG TPA: methyltransferase domain-containing protein [Burkholderiales bacterium]|nr:methyltransferase domain-containing protein [Burkholderiales bacterium]
MTPPFANRLGRKLSRVATNAAVRRPFLWRLFRPLIRRQFDSLAPVWDTMRAPASFLAYETALAAVDPPPKRALDLGTGTGVGALAIAQRFPDVEVVGADMADRMLAEARKKIPAGLEGRVRFEHADASALPFADASFDLVTLANMIPFFDELSRVLAPGGQALFSFSAGVDTPIYVPSERLRAELGSRGFTEFADFAGGQGTALLARKGDRA